MSVAGTFIVCWFIAVAVMALVASHKTERREDKRIDSLLQDMRYKGEGCENVGDDQN